VVTAPTFDRRVTAARPEIAAAHLAGAVTAARFVEGEVRAVIAPHAPLRRAPVPDAMLDTEALRGERFTVYEASEEGWSWGQLADDDYVGWLPSEALGAPGPAPTHRVAALRTIRFAAPSIKAPPLGALPFGARVAVVEVRGRWARDADGGHIPLPHLTPLSAHDDDFVAVAERFMGAPYLWGGKTVAGIDCSALVQIALQACGLSCPRDSDMQQAALGSPFAGGLAGLRRGDLMFWKGHVGIMRDATTLLHANAFHMAVACEPVADAIPRIRATDGEPTAVKRLEA
jgi:cell wall-associated NlpC family hydrolase